MLREVISFKRGGVENGVFGWLIEIYLPWPKVWIQLFFPSACDPIDQDPIAAHCYDGESTQRVKRKSLWVELHPIPWNKTLVLKVLILHSCLNFSSNLGLPTLSERCIGSTVMVTLWSWKQSNCLLGAKGKLKNLDISDFLHGVPTLHGVFYERKSLSC